MYTLYYMLLGMIYIVKILVCSFIYILLGKIKNIEYPLRWKHL